MKKKKSVRLRKIRKRSTNKSVRYVAAKFIYIFDSFFYKNLQFGIKKISIFKFLISFYCLNFRIVRNIFKNLGIYNSYKSDLKIKKSKSSKILNNKFRRLLLNNKYFFDFKKVSVIKYNLFFKLKSFSFNSKSLRFFNVENKKKMTLYFSYRHILALPVRGQRTKTNAKTRKNYNII